MLKQIEIDFVHKRENNSHSEQILNDNKERLNSQCKLILGLLQGGIVLTVRDAMIKYGIGDLRRRVCDLKEKGIDIKSRLIDGRFKEYFL
jgi:hypothetical protein